MGSTNANTTSDSKNSATIIDVHMIDRSGRYHIGPETPPHIKHDNGFLDQFPMREPTMADRLALAKWIALLEGSEALRPDLADANAAYRHFLFGNGKDRTISYQRYIDNDPSGKKTLTSIEADFKHHAEKIGENREYFEITGDTYPAGSEPTFLPYPQTENWQKAIGAHFAWVSGKVRISIDPKNGKDRYTADIIIHMEDRYNFNPGAHDIATGAPDADNGIFEITGLAHQYTNRGHISRTLTWIEGEGRNLDAKTNKSDEISDRRPQDNRRIRNRL
ncbi:hypothetical protein [Ralstonia solanacearum]|uniref:hypothetical protein n=1 Tax=Ralstonia solanacearum TaxID=305 RepID=UPI000AB2E2F6|nr:hypothetical protein [Ralstonia solanacearum]